MERVEKTNLKRELLWLWRSSYGVRWRLLFTATLGMLRIAASLLFVFVSKQLIDLATASFQSNSSISSSILSFSSLSSEQINNRMWLYAIALISLSLFQIFANILSSYFSNQTEIRMKNSLKHKLFNHLIHVKWGGAENFHTGDLINRLEEDVRMVSSTICRSLPNILVTTINLIAAFIFLCSMNAFLAWAVIIIAPLFIIFSRMYVKKVRSITKKIRSSDSQIQSTIQESLQHRVLIQSMEKEVVMSDKLKSSQDKLYDQTMARTRFSLFSRSMVGTGFSGSYLAVFLYSVWQIKKGLISFGSMTAFLQLVNQIQRPIIELTRYIPEFVHASTSVDRLIELEILETDKQESPIYLDDTAGVRFKNVSYRYNGGKRYILKDFSCDFAPGTRSAILGETGSGKSTTIRLILSLLTPQSGDIEIYSKVNPAGIKASERTRCNIDYIPQGNSLLSGTIRDNLLLGKENATEQEIKQALYTAVAEFVYELPEGIDTPIGERGGGLSEGQAQRIAIARGLLRPGSIMLLDEFSSSLDNATEERLISRLIDGYKDKTMIFITHREKIVEYCSQTVKLERLKDDIVSNLLENISQII